MINFFANWGYFVVSSAKYPKINENEMQKIYKKIRDFDSDNVSLKYRIDKSIIPMITKMTQKK